MSPWKSSIGTQWVKDKINISGYVCRIKYSWYNYVKFTYVKYEKKKTEVHAIMSVVLLRIHWAIAFYRHSGYKMFKYRI